jgi:ribosomal protein L2
MRLMLLISAFVILCWPAVAVGAEGAADIVLLGGTVVSIDHESSSITLKLPSGESRLFALTDRRVLGNISLGDHVTYELNEAGKIIRIVKLPTDPAN